MRWPNANAIGGMRIDLARSEGGCGVSFLRLLSESNNEEDRELVEFFRERGRERAEIAERRATSGYAYFAQPVNGGPIKIGHSDHPEYRVREIHWNRGDRVRLILKIPGGRRKERELHKRFAALRAHGEWFYADEPLVGFIRELAAQEASDPKENAK